jgi:4-deoxy-L-threo-5-hexosulose-uronate ketol-isomerase
MGTHRYAIHPDDFRTYDTTRIRESFLLETIFAPDRLLYYYTHYDRMIVGGAAPETQDVTLETLPELKADFFLQRRELGIINVGQPGSISVNGKPLTLGTKEALYIGKDTREVTFHPAKQGHALYYFNSAPAHAVFPTRKITLAEAETVELGTLEMSNHRTIRKLIVNSVLPTCHLQMGLTELKPGSVWNTMPAHTHARRMEAYFYFDVPDNQMICHFLGEPQETRHIWMKNHQGVLSPPWSIHSGAGTSNYSFIWGMAGENLDYGDMDAVKPEELQ